MLAGVGCGAFDTLDDASGAMIKPALPQQHVAPTAADVEGEV
jgi:hypothetical protein